MCMPGQGPMSSSVSRYPRITWAFVARGWSSRWCVWLQILAKVPMFVRRLIAQRCSHHPRTSEARDVCGSTQQLGRCHGGSALPACSWVLWSVQTKFRFGEGGAALPPFFFPPAARGMRGSRWLSRDLGGLRPCGYDLLNTVGDIRITAPVFTLAGPNDIASYIVDRIRSLSGCTSYDAPIATAACSRSSSS